MRKRIYFITVLISYNLYMMYFFIIFTVGWCNSSDLPRWGLRHIPGPGSLREWATRGVWGIPQQVSLKIIYYRLLKRAQPFPLQFFLYFSKCNINFKIYIFKPAGSIHFYFKANSHDHFATIWKRKLGKYAKLHVKIPFKMQN